MLKLRTVYDALIVACGFAIGIFIVFYLTIAVVFGGA
jgi:hypothetical protein